MNLPPDLAALRQLSGATVTQILRDLPSRRVFQIRLGGRTAYLKQFLGENRAAMAQGAHDRMIQADAAFGPGPNRAARPLMIFPAQGAVVIAPAAGQPLAHSLAQAGPQERARLIGRAGGWLAALAAAGPETGRFGPGFWLRKCQDSARAAQDDWIDRDLVDALLARMRTQAVDLRQIPVRRGRLHGDLTGDNLFHDPGTDLLTGIDLQDWGMMPVARDMARLLVWLESRRTLPLPRCDGVARVDHMALTSVPGLLPADQQPILRFMLGQIMLAYYLDSGRQPVRRAALASAMRHWSA